MDPSIRPLPANTYRGRFAPSPTGSLHFGSIVCAVSSFLQARCQQGDWLVRIEDIDPPREVAGSADQILSTLETLGLNWDGDVLYQSTRLEAYEYALEQLRRNNAIYRCQCSRKIIISAQKNATNKIYPGTCKINPLSPNTKNTAIRVNVSPCRIQFTDTIQGPFSQLLHKEVGDFILKRADGLIAYQLAVVVDDAYQNITEIVRGADLLGNTPRQIYLQDLLGLRQLNYSHLPLAVDHTGVKISKSTYSTSVDVKKPVETIFSALNFLGQNPPKELLNDTLSTIWQWAIKNWDINKIPPIKQKPIINTAS